MNIRPTIQLHRSVLELVFNIQALCKDIVNDQIGTPWGLTGARKASGHWDRWGTVSGGIQSKSLDLFCLVAMFWVVLVTHRRAQINIIFELPSSNDPLRNL